MALNPGTESLLRIEAPADVRVVSMPAASGSVSKGQPLFMLAAFSVERFEIQLSLFSRQIEIMTKPFQDGRVDAEIGLIKAKAQLLKENADLIKANQDREAQEAHNNRFTAGPGAPRPNLFVLTSSDTRDEGRNLISQTTGLMPEPDYVNPVDLQISFNNNQAAYLEAQLAADQSDMKKQDALAKIELAKSKLAEHQKLLDELKSTLTIVAPLGGKFIAHVAVGLSVKRGHTLGEIMP
jgi:biotin carboxyl carrier protein